MVGPSSPRLKAGGAAGTTWVDAGRWCAIPLRAALVAVVLVVLILLAGRDVPAAFPLVALGAAVLERDGLNDVIGEDDRLSMTLSTAVAAHRVATPTED